MEQAGAERVAIVTGGGSGIGRALALALAARGARVIVAGRRAERLAETVALGAAGRIRAQVADVTNAGDNRALLEEALAREGRLDLFVANAGVGHAGEVIDSTPQDWAEQLDVNLRGVLHGVAVAYPHFVAQRSGHLLLIGSAAGLMPRPGMAPYATAKHAVTGLALSLRAEAKRHGVGVTLAAPGPVQSEILAAGTWRNLDAAPIRARFEQAQLPAEVCARRILDAVERNRALVLTNGISRIEWWAYRLAPALGLRLAELRFHLMRRLAAPR